MTMAATATLSKEERLAAHNAALHARTADFDFFDYQADESLPVA